MKRVLITSELLHAKRLSALAAFSLERFRQAKPEQSVTVIGRVPFAGR
jgi:hypothetical protein